MAKSYDPFALERPTIRLGELGEWVLGDITESRSKLLVEIGERFQAFAASDDPAFGEVLELVVSLCEAAFEEPAGFGDALRGLCDESVHGGKALGVRALEGLVAHVMDWLSAESDAGNE